MVHSSSGLVIAGCFIAALLGMSIMSRAYRAGEMRTIGFDFTDEQSKFLWDSLRVRIFRSWCRIGPVGTTGPPRKI